MGIFCIVLGIIILIGFSGGGFLMGKMIAANETIAYLLGVDGVAPGMILGVSIGVCAFIGLLICLGLVMNGLIYNRLNKVNASAIKAYKAAKRANHDD